MRIAVSMHRWKVPLFAAVVAAASMTSAVASAQSYVASPESQLSAITSWWDSARGTQFVVYVSQYDSIVVLSCGSSGCWTVAAQDPVSGIAPGGLDSSNPVLPFYGGTQLVSTYDGSNGHIFFIGWKLSSSLQYENVGDLFEEHMDSSNNWSGQSVTAAAGASTQPWNGNGDGLAPYLMSSLSSLYANNRSHVFYVGSAESRVHDAYYDGAWHDVPVTGSFTDPPFMGLNLTSYYDGFEHVYAAGQEVYASCDECGWAVGNAPALNFGYVVGQNFGAESIWGWGATNYGWITEEYFWGGWSTFTTYSPNYDPYSPLLTYADDTYYRGFYVGGDQHIYQAGYPEDITQETGAPLVAMGSDDDALAPITGYYDGMNDHVFFIGADQHVHELYMSSSYRTGAWLQNDLTLSSGATEYGQLPSLP